MKQEDKILIQKLESIGCVPSAKYRFLFKDQLFYVNDIINPGTLQVMDRFVIQDKLKELIIKSDKILNEIQAIYPGLTNEEMRGLNLDEDHYEKDGINLQYITQTPDGSVSYYSEDLKKAYPSKHLENVGFINKSEAINKIEDIRKRNGKEYKL